MLPIQWPIYTASGLTITDTELQVRNFNLNLWGYYKPREGPNSQKTLR